MSISKDKHTCSECDFFVHAESQVGDCRLNPPTGTHKPGPDPYPAVQCDGKGCSHHSKRGKKGK